MLKSDLLRCIKKNSSLPAKRVTYSKKFCWSSMIIGQNYNPPVYFECFYLWSFSWGMWFYSIQSTLGCLCDNWNPAFCLASYLTGVHFRGELYWSRVWWKNQVSTSQNSKNSWFQIVRRIIRLNLNGSFSIGLSINWLICWFMYKSENNC